jgi:hypothetical protein
VLHLRCACFFGRLQRSLRAAHKPQLMGVLVRPDIASAPSAAWACHDGPVAAADMAAERLLLDIQFKEDHRRSIWQRDTLQVGGA